MCVWGNSPRLFCSKQGRKRPLDTPKRMIERREREGEREKVREREREREREVKGAQRKPNPSPNAFPKLWDARVKKGGGSARFPIGQFNFLKAKYCKS